MNRIEKFAHNSTVADSEPDWGSVDKTALPRAAFADQGEAGKKSTWTYPHHWVKDGGNKDKDGIFTTGTLYLHKGGLNAAWAAANGAHTGQQASQAVKDHLQAHRKALGIQDSMPDRCRAYSTLEVKSFDDERRIIEGIASTPTPDRMEDIVVPEGIEYSLPLPFLYQHNSRQPIGKVIAAKTDSSAMTIVAQLAPLGTAGFIDEAWNLIKTGLVRGLSIGFRSLEETYDRITGGFKYIRTELFEISAVTIPANAEASITAIKSADAVALAALGHGRRAPVRLDHKSIIPGVSGHEKGTSMKTIAEQIASFEVKRASSVARMTEIMNKAGEEGRTLEDAETQEYDGLQADVKSIDEHLTRLKAHEKAMIATATPVDPKTVTSPETASKVRPGVVVSKGPDLPPGTAFVRYAMALAACRGNRAEAHALALAQAHWKDTTPQVEQVLSNPQLHRHLKAAVDAGTTTDTGWAAELAQYIWMASEFIEFLRPQTIIGKIVGFRRVPFNVKMPLQDAGSSVGWVGQGSRKPVSKLNFDTTQLGIAKAAGIVVLTDELVRVSNPSAEAIVRQDMAGAIRQFLDEQFVDPTIAESANVSPASVTNGASNSAASGTSADDFRADFKTAITAIIANEIDPSTLTIAMRPSQAIAMSLMRNALGQKEFPDITASGGKLEGYPVITSNSVPSGDVVFLVPAEILLADDGGITIDASREASLVMDDGGSPNVTTMVSMWQNNMIALRVERVINWKRRRSEAVYYLTSCDYGAGSPA